MFAITLTVLLVFTAFVVTILSTRGRVPLWIAVLLLCIVELVQILPVK